MRIEHRVPLHVENVVGMTAKNPGITTGEAAGHDVGDVKNHITQDVCALRMSKNRSLIYLVDQLNLPVMVVNGGSGCSVGWQIHLYWSKLIW